MAKNIQKALWDYRFAYETWNKIPCTKAENEEYREILANDGKLPEGVLAYEYDGQITFCIARESGLTDDELKEYLTYKQISLLETIKNCALAFMILTGIGILVSILVVLGVI